MEMVLRQERSASIRLNGNPLPFCFCSTSDISPHKKFEAERDTICACGAYTRSTWTRKDLSPYGVKGCLRKRCWKERPAATPTIHSSNDSRSIRIRFRRCACICISYAMSRYGGVTRLIAQKLEDEGVSPRCRLLLASFNMSWII